jgi:hypothetical protein
MHSLRDVYRTDWPLDGRPEAEAIERTVRHSCQLELDFDGHGPTSWCRRSQREDAHSRTPHRAPPQDQVLFLFTRKAGAMTVIRTEESARLANSDVGRRRGMA